MAGFFSGMINWLIESGAGILIALLALLPDSPFSEPSTPPSGINLGYITWLFDFPTWISHFATLLIAIGAYYAIRVVARWVKMARN